MGLVYVSADRSLKLRRLARLLVIVLVAALVAQLGVTAAIAQPSSSPEDETPGEAASDQQADGEPLVRPDVFTAQLTARQTDRRVEIASLTTATSRTFANPDGTFTDELHAGPERTFDPDAGPEGVWRDIDTTLVRRGGLVVPRVAAAELAFSGGGDGPAVMLEGDLEDAEEAAGRAEDPNGQPNGDEAAPAPIAMELNWAGVRLPEPELDGNVALYRDVQPGVDLELEALPAGYAKRLIVRDRPTEPPTWRFELDVSDDLDISDAEGGGLEVTDSDGEVVIAIDGLWMWGAVRDIQSDEPVHVAEVDATLIERDGTNVLEVTPDFAFLSDPDVTYPVTIDPTASLSLSGDTFVQSNIANTSQWSATELRVGTYDGGSTKARTLIRFNTGPVAGKKILSASMELYNFHSWSCTARRVNVRRLTSGFDSSTVWSTRPSASSTVDANPNFARGYSSSCAAGFQAFDVTGRVQSWADGAANHGLLLISPDETDNLTWKKFRSSEASSNRPKLTVTYNSYPTGVTSRSETPVSGGFVTDVRPTLNGKFNDPDGGSGRVQYRVYNSAGSQIYIGLGSQVSSGSNSPLKLPSSTLEHAKTYTWQARGYDGSLYGPWSATRSITVDVAGPSTPTISSSTHPSTTDWYTDGAISASWTASSDSPAGVDGYAIAFNKDATFVPSGSLQTSRTYSRSSTSTGIWYLHVRPRDKAGNWGTTTRRRFNIGTAGLLTPEEGTRTQRRVPVQVAGPSALTSATLQWQRPGGTWANVSASRLALASSPDTPLTSNVLPMLNGQTAEVVWDVAGSVGAEDGPIHLRARFNDATVTDPVRIGLDRVGAGKDHGAIDLGPGTVSLLSGNLNVTDADASIAAWTSDLTVTRTHNSRAEAGDDPLFGPGWVSGVAVLEAGAGWDALSTPGHGSTSTAAPYVLLTDVEGAEVWFDRDGTVYVPEPGFEDLTLTFASSTYTLTDLDGTVTTFKPRDGIFRPDTVTQSGQAGTTRYRWATIDGRMRPTRVVAPHPDTISCSLTATSLARGCRALDLIYGPTAGGTRLTGVDLLAWENPDATTMSRIRLINYSYDTDGRLTGVTDPRVTPSLTTSYSYDTQGRLSTVTPPGLEAWTITYAATSGANRGRVRTVRRPNLAGGTSQTTLVYDVPRTNLDTPNKAPYPMGPADVAVWGQTRSIPTDATAIFPPDAIPPSTTASNLNTADYARADITYLEASGRVTNTAAPGGRITTVEYDIHGNPIRELTAANRARVLAAPAAQRASLASRLDTTRTYSLDGLALLEERGPEHEIELTTGTGAGQRVQARQTTRYTYDQGLPGSWTGDKPLLPTTTTVGALLANGTYNDVRTTTTAYNWELRLPTVITVDPSGLNIRTTTVYDAAGLEIERRQPSEPSGGGPGTLRTIRYTAGTHPTHNSQCGNRPEWHGQLCLHTPAAQPPINANTPGLITTHTTGYDLYLQPTTVAETAPTSTGNATRSTAIGSDAAGRIATVTITASTGTPVPTVTTSYDPTTGLPTTTSTEDGQIVRSYDTLGRLVSYTDAAGNTATTSYDPHGRVATVNDGRGTRTFTYDPATWHVTKIVDSHAGIFETTPGDYDADGTLTAWSGPHGLRTELSVDPSGATTGQTVTQTQGCTGEDCVWWAEGTVSSIHGQWVTHDRPIAERTYHYDPAGRLTDTTDTIDGACTSRRYTFGNTAVGRNSNRTAKTNLGTNPDGSCNQTVIATTSYTYDTGDRLTAGTVYDGLGRALQLPGALVDGNGPLAATYHVNDLVATLTQNSESRTYTLDPAMRFATETDHTGATTGWRYADDSDSPAWHATPSGGWTRNVTGLAGDLAATLTFDGETTRLTTTLTDLHGSVVMHIDTDQQGGNPTPTATLLTDEFGIPIAGSARYGWHGAKQRHTALPSGAILMGVRLYVPHLGRFAQTDPVLGGSDNAYEYASGDCVNNVDLDGRSVQQRRAQCMQRNAGTYQLLRRLAGFSAGSAALSFLLWAIPKALIAVARYLEIQPALKGGPWLRRVARSVSNAGKIKWLVRGANLFGRIGALSTVVTGIGVAGLIVIRSYCEYDARRRA